jgi:hypothetical protein
MIFFIPGGDSSEGPSNLKRSGRGISPRKKQQCKHWINLHNLSIATVHVTIDYITAVKLARVSERD